MVSAGATEVVTAGGPYLTHWKFHPTFHDKHLALLAQVAFSEELDVCHTFTVEELTASESVAPLRVGK